MKKAVGGGKYDLVIVGFGIVGTTAALLATRYKLRTAVIDLNAFDDLPITKAARIDAEAFRVFEHLGLRKPLQDILRPLEGTRMVDQDGNLLFELQHRQYQRHSPMYGFYQPDLQGCLQEQLKKTEAGYLDFYEKHRAEAIEPQKNGVQLHLYRLADKEFFQIETRFLLACNGQDSLIPALCNLEYHYYDFIGYTLNVDTETEAALPLPRFAQTICGAEMPVTYVADSDNRQRWEFQLRPDEVNEAASSQKVRQWLEEQIRQPFIIKNTFVHRFEAKILNRWQSKRVYICGDAAHILPPYLGLGLSAGIKDVYNLIWKIAMVSERRIEGQVLDYYQGERESDIRYLLRLNLVVKSLFSASWLKWVRRLLPIIPKSFLRRTLHIETLVKYGLVGSSHRLRGRFIPSFLFQTLQGKQAILDELAGDGFVFLALDENPVDAAKPEELEYLAAISLRFVKVFSAQQKFIPQGRFADFWLDSEGAFEKWCCTHRIKYLILRPDRIIFDAARNEKELRRVLRLLQKKMKVNRGV